MGKYRKLITAIVGLVVVVLGPSFLGVSPEGTIMGIAPDMAVQAIISVLTAFGVYQISNDTA